MPAPARLPAAVALALALAFAAVAAAQPAEAEKLLRERLAAFEQARVRAGDKALKAFDNAIRTARTSPKIKESARQEFIDKCEAAKSRYEKDGRWPADPALGLLDDELAYHTQLGQAFAPVSAQYDRLLKLYRAANDDFSVTRALSDKATLVAAAFPAQEEFTAGSTWDGKRVGPKGNGNTHLHLKLKTVREASASFEGVIHQDPDKAGHPVFEVAGALDGNRLVFNSTKQLKGATRHLTFTGYLSTGRMFLAIGGKGSDGKAVNDHAVLERTGGGPKKKN